MSILKAKHPSSLKTHESSSKTHASKEAIDEWPIQVFLNQYGEYAVKEQCDQCMKQIYTYFANGVKLVDDYDTEMKRKAIYIGKSGLTKTDVKVSTVEDLVDIVGLSLAQPKLDDVKDVLLNWKAEPHLKSHKRNPKIKSKWFPKFPSASAYATQELYKNYLEKVYTESDRGPWFPPWVAFPVISIQFLLGLICLIIIGAYGWRMPSTYVYQWLVTAFVSWTLHALFLENIKVFIISIFGTFSVKWPICPTTRQFVKCLDRCIGLFWNRNKKKRKKLFWFS